MLCGSGSSMPKLSHDTSKSPCAGLVGFLGESESGIPFLPVEGRMVPGTSVISLGNVLPSGLWCKDFLGKLEWLLFHEDTQLRALGWTMLHPLAHICTTKSKTSFGSNSLRMLSINSIPTISYTSYTPT